MSIEERIKALRKEMDKHNIDAYIIPSSDPHQGEYVADHWKSREWISGFTGSAGTVVVTQNHMGLWTDSRYYLQAPKELKEGGGSLHKMDGQDQYPYIGWLEDQLTSGSTVGLDGRLFTVKQVRKMKSRLADEEIILDADLQLIQDIWKGRPPLPVAQVEDYPESYAGESREEKLMRIQQRIREKETDAALLSALDDIAWTLNIRGKDVAYNPVVYSYLLVFLNRAVLFIDKAKVPAALMNLLGNANVEVVDYDKINDYLSALSSGIQLWIDPNQISYDLVESINNAAILEEELPVQLMKAIKNDTEVKHIRHAMVKDGVALVKTFKWLEAEVKERKVKETEVAEKLAHFRSKQVLYQGESFSAIVGYKSNGAIVHYHAEEEDCAEIENEGVLLVDSGGQYLDGTTDITRTFCFDKPSEDFKDAYTRVLKGHIALAKAIFPEGTKGVQLDILARQYLWDAGLNFGHGTGHGVGFFLNVHEPPQGFVPGLGQRGVTEFKKGMFTSNEPGYYKEGEYGIRIENLVLSVEKEDSEHGRFLCFDTLTLYPISTRLIQKDMLTPEERKWLNEYHERVFHALAPQLTEEEREWLKEQCEAIGDGR